MPDVNITNPEIDFTLADGESTTVPAGEQWIVDLSANAGNLQVRGPGGAVLLIVNSERRPRVVLSGGDKLESFTTSAAIRGWVVS